MASTSGGRRAAPSASAPFAVALWMKPPPSTRAWPDRRIVEHAGLAGGYALFAGDEFDFITAVGRAQPRRLRRAGRSHPHENLEPLADRAIERAVADPVDVAQRDAIHPQRLARTDHDAAAGGLKPHHIERRAGGDAQSAPLADGEMNDALMPADDAAVEVDDIAGLEPRSAASGR